MPEREGGKGVLIYPSLGLSGRPLPEKWLVRRIDESERIFLMQVSKVSV